MSRLAARLETGVALCLCTGLGTSGAADAQDRAVPVTPPPATTQADTAQPAEVVVTSKTQPYTSDLGLRSYSTANDLQKATGALADLLRNVPSIQVDSSGVVSLRGNTSVTILVDGKPSALLSGPNRSQVLLQLPASQFDRVEVLTTPSAAYTTDGAGGVINLISRKAAPTRSSTSTLTGSIDANVGTGDRATLGGTAALKTQKLSLSGGINFRRSEGVTQTRTTLDYGPQSPGEPEYATQSTTRKVVGNTMTANASADYDLDPSTRLSGSFSHVEDRSPGIIHGFYDGVSSSGQSVLGFDSTGPLHQHYSSNSESFSLNRKLPGADSELLFLVNSGQTHIYVSIVTAYAYAQPTQLDVAQDVAQSLDIQQIGGKAQYKVAPNKDVKIVSGYEIQIEHTRNGDSGMSGDSLADATSSPALLDIFKATQNVQSLYVTYEQTHGRLTIQPGVRLEYTSINADSIAALVSKSQAYSGAYPTLNLSYDLGAGGQLKLNLGRRIERPGLAQLNPFRFEVSSVLFIAGNPNLKPATTDSYEFGYEFKKGAVDYQATLYHRQTAGLFNQVDSNLGGGVILETNENIGHSQDTGLELVASRNVTKSISVNASGSLAQSEINASNIGFVGSRSIGVISGRVSFNWQATRRDFFQLDLQASGKKLTAQGYQDNYTTINGGWRHTFDKALSSVVTFADPFDAYRQTTVINTVLLHSRATATIRDQAIFFGLNYAFGGSTPSSGGFNFSGGPAAPR